MPLENRKKLQTFNVVGLRGECKMIEAMQKRKQTAETSVFWSGRFLQHPWNSGSLARAQRQWLPIADFDSRLVLEKIMHSSSCTLHKMSSCWLLLYISTLCTPYHFVLHTNLENIRKQTRMYLPHLPASSQWSLLVISILPFVLFAFMKLSRK